MNADENHRSSTWNSPNDSIAVHRDSPLQKQLEEKQHNRQLVSHEVSNLKKVLEDIEDEIYTLENQIEVERKAFNQHVRFIFFDYLPAQDHNYSHTIGPVNYDIIENEDRIGDIKVCHSLGRHYRHLSPSIEFLCGTNQHTKQRVSLKKFDKEHYAELSLLIGLEKEIDVHSLLIHPNIIQFHHVMHAPRHIYLVTEFAYMDLDQYLHLHNDCVSLDMLREVTIGVLWGLKYLHDHGVAHLDLRQENIYLSGMEKYDHATELSRHHIRIGNFRSCAVHPYAGMPVPVRGKVGTTGFIAPEILGELTNTDGRSADLWSLGVMLLWIADGELSESWMHAYSHEENYHSYEDELCQCLAAFGERQEASVDLELHDMICKMLVMKSSRRLTSSQALRHPWLRLNCNQAMLYPDGHRQHRHTM